MLINLLNILLIALLILCIVQDWKYRGIHVLVFPILLALTISLNFLQEFNFLDLGFSLAFIGLNLLILVIYLSIKNKAFVNIFKSYLGIGDVLFFIAIAPLFSFRNYILFFISGMILSMILHLILGKFQKHDNVPLAGYLSMYVLILIGINYFNPNFLKVNLL
ncbi:MAG: prepilin peptidase [Putridiphycobacter sp.]